MLDLTNLTLTPVQWPGYPPVMLLPSGEQIVQILVWVPAISRWLRLGSQGRRIDGAAVDLTFAELRYLAQAIAAGSPLAQALNLLFTS